MVGERDRSDQHSYGGGEAAEAALAAPMVVGVLDPVHDRVTELRTGCPAVQQSRELFELL